MGTRRAEVTCPGAQGNLGEELSLSPDLLTPGPGGLTINHYSVHSFSKHVLSTCCAGTLLEWGSLVNWRDPGPSPVQTDSPVQGKGNKHLNIQHQSCC